MKDSALKHEAKTSSLLPYLEPAKEKCALRLSITPQDASAQGETRTPFLAISDSAPFTSLIQAQFVSDAGSTIRNVFVLLQKDAYHFTKDELWPVTNEDVEKWWHNAFSFYSNKDQDDSVMVLADQLNGNGEFLPFQSLWFCTQKHVFFHPLCYKCGYPLQLCSDDDLLSSVGLQPYSTSLKRYVFCSSCFALEGNTDFYVFARGLSDPSIVKDRWDMMRELGELKECKDHMGQFPCVECPHHQECYGSQGLVVSRVVPFSFYPFYMLIFEAMSVTAPDFLSLISGASFEELEAKLDGKHELGRKAILKTLKRKSHHNPLFFFDRDERYFLEILY